MREQRIVHHALRQIGFVGVSPMDWIFRAGEVTCAIPLEATSTAQSAIQFLREGAFQDSLLKKTRLTYYRLADQLARCLQMKGIYERPKPERLYQTN